MSSSLVAAGSNNAQISPWRTEQGSRCTPRALRQVWKSLSPGQCRKPAVEVDRPEPMQW
jgi:hypothetical protein